MASSRIAELAATIQKNVGAVNDHLNAQGLPQPSFDENATVNPQLASPDAENSRIQALDATIELYDLLVGPIEQVRPILNATSLQFIYKFDIPSKIPLNCSVPYATIASQIAQPEPTVRRVIRFAIAHHRIFQEKQPGLVSHSASSRYLREDESARDGLGLMFDEAYQSFGNTVEALSEKRDSAPPRTGWNLANKTDMPIFEFAGRNPERARRFGSAMSSFSNLPSLKVQFLIDGYNWSSLGDAAIVDVGGADGYASIALAKKFPKLKFVVQDTASSTEKFQDTCPPQVADRVKFVAHDFFQPQPQKARAYLLRQILHNWSDEKCLEIIKALIPGLEPGSRIIINDHLVHPPGKLPPYLERHARGMDMIMLSLFNTRDYEAEEWRHLFRTADSRFGEIKVWQPKGSQLAIVEATWTGEIISLPHFAKT